MQNSELHPSTYIIRWVTVKVSRLAVLPPLNSHTRVTVSLEEQGFDLVIAIIYFIVRS